MLGRRLRLGGLEHAFEPAQEGERQDDLAVVGALVVTAQEVGDTPDEVGEFGEGYGVCGVHANSLRRKADGIDRKGRIFVGDGAQVVAPLLAVLTAGMKTDIDVAHCISSLLPFIPRTF